MALNGSVLAQSIKSAIEATMGTTITDMRPLNAICGAIVSHIQGAGVINTTVTTAVLVDTYTGIGTGTGTGVGTIS